MKAARRFLFLTQTYPRFDGDTSGPFIRDLARALVAAGDKVTVLTPHAEEVAARWQDGGVEVQSFRYGPERLELIGYSRSLDADEKMKAGAKAMAPFYVLGARRALHAELRRQSYDLVQAHWVVPNLFPAAAAARRIPVAVGPARQRRLPGGEARGAAAAGKVAEAGEGADRLLARAGRPGLPARFPGGTVAGHSLRGRQRHFRAGPVAPRDLAEQAGHPRGGAADPLGRPDGDQEGLPGAARRARSADDRTCPGCHLVLAGAGDRLAEFQQKAEAWQGRVHFPGAVYRDALPDLYRAADIFVLPAVHDPKGNVDGLPNVILEAMASRLPVVSTAISGIPLAVRDGDNGRLVPEQDGKRLVDALLELLAAPDQAKAMGEVGRRDAVENLSWRAVAATLPRGLRAGPNMGATASIGSGAEGPPWDRRLRSASSPAPEPSWSSAVPGPTGSAKSRVDEVAVRHFPLSASASPGRRRPAGG